MLWLHQTAAFQCSSHIPHKLLLPPPLLLLLLLLLFVQGNRLIKAAFFDVPLLTTSLCVLPSKGFILTGDMQYGASFVLYRWGRGGPLNVAKFWDDVWKGVKG
jgi:hypothetical protein